MTPSRAAGCGFRIKPLDLLLLLSVVGVLFSVTAQMVTQLVPRYRVRRAAHDIAGALRDARHIAVREELPIGLSFEVDDARYLVVDGVKAEPGERRVRVARHAVRLPEGVRYVHPEAQRPALTLAPPGQASGGVEFDSRGLPRGARDTGHVYVGDPRCEVYWRVGVDVAGSVRVESWSDGGWSSTTQPGAAP